jgi:hypothetical protein
LLPIAKKQFTLSKQTSNNSINQDITFILQTLCMKETSPLFRKGLLKPTVFLLASLFGKAAIFNSKEEKEKSEITKNNLFRSPKPLATAFS